MTLRSEPLLWLLPLLPEATGEHPPYSGSLPSELASQPLRPMRRSGLIGRALMHLRPANTHHLETAAVVVLWGEPGLGKATAARWITQVLRADYRDGCLQGRWLQEMSAGARGQQLVAWLRQLGQGDVLLTATLEDLIARWQSSIAQRRVIVWLETDELPSSLAQLIPQTSGCAVVLTTRQPVEGLPHSLNLELPPLEIEDAIALLATAADREDTAIDPQLWQPLARTCEGIPLALELAGSALRNTPDAALAEAIAQASAVQTHPGAVASQFLQLCRGLSPAAQTLLYRAALLPSPILCQDLAACLLQGEPADIPGVLGELVERRCIGVEGEEYPFSHSLIRLLAKRQLASTEPAAMRRQLRQAISRWYARALLALAAASHPQHLGAATSTPVQLLARYRQHVTTRQQWLQRHWANAIAAWDWAEAVDMATRLAIGLSLSQLGEPVPTELPLAELELLLAQQAAPWYAGAAQAQARRGRYSQARDYYEKSLAQLSAHQLWQQAQVRANLGLICGYLGQEAAHRDHWHSALAQLSGHEELQHSIHRWMQVSAAATAATLLPEEPLPATGNRFSRLVKQLFT